MRYIISDIHGCYRQYQALLDKLHLTDADHLYILGDSVDRGPQPIKVLEDLIQREHVTYIMGNHDFLFLYFFGKKGLDLSDKNIEDCKPEDILDFHYWLKDGGITTAKQYMPLSPERKAAICAFLEKAKGYAVIEDAGKRYILVHAGIAGFKEDVPLKKYGVMDFIYERADYHKRYYRAPDTFLVTGHTPTAVIREDCISEVYTGNGHIAIDCGCIYGGRLAAYCIETGKAVYVEGRK